MKKYLLQLGQWLVRKYGSPPKPIQKQYLPPLDAALVASTRGLVSMVSTWDSSGEYKRHHVLSKLIKQHPDVDKKVLGLTIEMVLLQYV